MSPHASGNRPMVAAPSLGSDHFAPNAAGALGEARPERQRGPLADWYNIIAGNKYRLAVGMDYRYGTVYVKWVGTHDEYDDIDVRKV